MQHAWWNAAMRLKSTATLNQNCDFLEGFYPSAGYFFTFYLICIASMILMSAVYRLLAAASPNMDIASATGASQSKPRSLLPLTMAVLAFCGNTSALVLHKGLSMGQALFLPKVVHGAGGVVLLLIVMSGYAIIRTSVPPW